MSTQSVTFEEDGIPKRRISFITSKNELMIHDQHLEHNNDGTCEWKIDHISYPPNFNYSQSEFVGRVVQAAWQNGNSE